MCVILATLANVPMLTDILHQVPLGIGSILNGVVPCSGAVPGPCRQVLLVTGGLFHILCELAVANLYGSESPNGR